MSFAVEGMTYVALTQYYKLISFYIDFCGLVIISNVIIMNLRYCI